MINFFTVILIIFIVFFILIFKRKYIKRFLNKMNLFKNKSLTNKRNTIKNLPRKINFNYQNSSKNRSEFHKTALIKKMFKLFQNDTEDKLINALKKNINDYDLVIINQQITKGLHQNSFPTKLQEVIDATNIDFISDCRNKEVEYSNTFLKTNIHEAIQKGLFIEGDSDQPIIQKKIDKGFYKKIVISQESKGCLVFSGKEKIEIPVPRDVKDTVGGGDSLLTGISIGLISGCDMIQSTLIGCLSAFVTIQKPFQTGTVNPDEIMLSLKQIIN